MVDVIATVIAVALSWGVMMVAMRVLVGFVNLTLPENPEWGLKVLALVVITAVLDLIPWGGWIISMVVYWKLMRQWFDADLWAIVYVTVIGNLMMMGATAGIVALLAKL